MGLCLERRSSNHPIVCDVFGAETAHSSWQARGIFRTCARPVSCHRPVDCFSLSLLWTSASSAIFHRLSVSLVCCAEQDVGEFTEVHDRLATGLASWSVCIGRLHVLWSCRRAQWLVPRGVVCVHVCVRAVDSGGTAMDQSVRALCAPSYLHRVALHCPNACACVYLCPSVPVKVAVS